MLGIGFWVVDNLIVNFLVATFAQPARVMCSVFVLALRRLLLVALVEVAEVAHEFSLVPAVVMAANRHDPSQAGLCSEEWSWGPVR